MRALASTSNRREIRSSAAPIRSTRTSPWGADHAVPTNPHALGPAVGLETPILMADLTWRPASALNPGEWVLGFDEKPDPGTYRGFRVARVDGIAIGRAHAITLRTAFGVVTCTSNSLWLERNRFRRAAAIGSLRLATVPASPPSFEPAYKMGYLRGAMAGDGSFSWGPSQTRALLRVCDALFAARFARFGENLGFDGFREFVYSTGPGTRSLYGVRTSRVKEVSLLDPYAELNPSSEYMRGWLAGAFDAEGSNGGGAFLRIHQRISNRRFWDAATHFLAALRVPYVVELSSRCHTGGGERMGSLRIGRATNQLRFIAMTQPVLTRKWVHLLHTKIKGAVQAAPVVSRQEALVRTVISIRTSAGTLVQGGFLSHDCTAVPP